MSKNLKRLLALAVCLIVVATVVSITRNDVVAQIRAALIKNVDEPGRAPYQQSIEFDPASGSFTRFYLVSFPAVPAGKRLVVQHVSAMIGVTAGGQPDFLAFGDFYTLNTNNFALVNPPWTSKSTAVGPYWMADRDVLVYYEPGSTPKIKIGSSTDFSHANSILNVHGYLIDANN